MQSDRSVPTAWPHAQTRLGPWAPLGPQHPTYEHVIGLSDEVYGGAFSPDDRKIVLAVGDMSVRVVPLDAERARSTVLRGHRSFVHFADFSPDGARVVSASWDRTVRFWNPATATERTGDAITDHVEPVNAAVYSPDGRRLATVSDDRLAIVWDAARHQRLMVLHGHEGRVFGAAFSPDGARLVTASEDRTARVWELDGSERVDVLRGHDHAVLSAGFCGPNRIVTASNDLTAHLWARGPDGHFASWRELRGHEGLLTAAACSPDGKQIATVSEDSTVRVWDVESGEQRLLLLGHAGRVHSVVWSHDGKRLLSFSADRTARVWDLVPAEERVAEATSTEAITQLLSRNVDCLPAPLRARYLDEKPDVAHARHVACERSHGRPEPKDEDQ